MRAHACLLFALAHFAVAVFFRTLFSLVPSLHLGACWLLASSPSHWVLGGGAIRPPTLRRLGGGSAIRPLTVHLWGLLLAGLRALMQCFDIAAIRLLVIYPVFAEKDANSHRYLGSDRLRFYMFCVS